VVDPRPGQIQPQVGLAGPAIRTVTQKALIGQDRQNVAIEYHLAGRAGRSASERNGYDDQRQQCVSRTGGHGEEVRAGGGGRQTPIVSDFIGVHKKRTRRSEGSESGGFVPAGRHCRCFVAIGRGICTIHLGKSLALENHLMPTQPDNKFHDILEDFDTAMLVTRNHQGELRARPMVVADVDADATIWFLTQHESGKIGEILADEHVAVTMQSSTRYVSLTGLAEPVDDPGKIDKLWNESWKTWFPGGKDDPTLCLLRVRGDRGEYWDNSGGSGIEYLYEATKAYITGTRPDVDDDPDIHAKVNM
jgi:general stress protein 26